MSGRVEAIAIAAAAEAPMLPLERAAVSAGRGLEGDRYARGTGSFSANGGSGRDLTLVEAEAIEAVAGEGIDLAPVDARRNLITRGVALDSLLGRRFRIGAVICAGRRPCDPCAHLERLTEKPGLLRGLARRGGLRADVLEGGEIQVGDRLEDLGPA